MTATSHPKRRTARWASLESFGFFDSPSMSSTVAPPARPPQPDPQVTSLVRTGRHVRKTGATVEDMWNTTQLHAPSLVDWEPQSTMSSKLGHRNFRWPVVLVVLAMVAGAVGLGYWVYQRPNFEEANALDQVRADAATLSESLDRITPLVADLGSEQLPEANRDSSVYAAVGDAARLLFTVSADLGGQSALKTSASESASLALNVSRTLMDATAFRTVLEDSLTTPALETDPQLIDITAAALSFSDWRVGFESVREALPANVAAATSQALATLDTGLEARQSAYVDAMREKDRPAALNVLTSLDSDLADMRNVLLEDMQSISSEMTSLIEQSQAALDQLLG